MLEGNLFPQGHALGEAFYNRVRERKELAESILHHEHRVVVAPRRYGKSSLIRQVFLDMKIDGIRVDLLPATNLAFVHKAVKTCFTELAAKILPKTKGAREKVIHFIKGLHPKLTLKLLGQSLEVSTSQTIEEGITELLLSLDLIAKKLNKRLVICFDEFQQVGELKQSHAIEAAIRSAVEQSTNITYIFSGSSRHLLSQMFNAKSRPLYHLCELMVIDRIEADVYFKILAKRSKDKWKKALDDATINELLNLSHCHPYYVNALCRQVWKIKSLPKIHEIQAAWLNYVKSQSNWIGDDIGRISPNQRSIMAALASQPATELYSFDFMQRVKLGASSIKKSVELLLKIDFLCKTEDGVYRVLDPATENYLQRIEFFE